MKRKKILRKEILRVVPCAGAVLAFLAAAPLVAAPAPVARGLSFALSFDGRGRSVVSGPYVLHVPGAKGVLKVLFDSVAVTGGMLDAPFRLKNDSGVDLLGVRLDLGAVSESVRPGEGRPSAREQNVAPPSPLAWDAIRAGAETPGDLFRGGPISFSEETEVVVVLGVVSGLAAEPPDPKLVKLPESPTASECPDRAAGCRVDAEGSVWRIEPAAEGRRGGLSQRSASGAFVRSLRFEDDERPVDLARGADGRLFVSFEGGAVRSFRPF
jgi:hypothetical protein